MLYSSGTFDINVEFLAEIDRLVQLLESPGFTCQLSIQSFCQILL